MFFVFISISLIVLILLQPGKALNSATNLNSKNNIKFSNNIGVNIIAVFSCLFLFVSIILCNINNKKIDSDFILTDISKSTVLQKSLRNKTTLNSDIPH